MDETVPHSAESAKILEKCKVIWEPQCVQLFIKLLCPVPKLFCSGFEDVIHLSKQKYLILVLLQSIKYLHCYSTHAQCLLPVAVLSDAL